MLTIKIELYKECENTDSMGSNPLFKKLVDTHVFQSEKVHYNNFDRYKREAVADIDIFLRVFRGNQKLPEDVTFALRMTFDNMQVVLIEPPAIVYIMNEQGKTVDKITV